MEQESLKKQIDNKKSLRILIATHSPLSPEFGAGQMAINLAEAFKIQGHNVTLWSPPHSTQRIRSYQVFYKMRKSLKRFLEKENSFDVVDSPSFLVPSNIPNSTIIVARSVQPDILYTIHDLFGRKIKDWKEFMRIPLDIFISLYFIILVLTGWFRADLILCLGKVEFQWMERYMPWWKKKLSHYVNALSKQDQYTLAQVRERRKKIDVEKIHCLWIGRWANHKGIKELTNYIENCIKLFPSFHFTIAGYGNEAEKSFSKNIIHSGRLLFIPSFSRDLLPTLLSEHDIGLFTSRVEGWGLILNEMLESGMPVLATETGGVLDLQSFFEKMIYQFPLLDFPATFQTNLKSELDRYYTVFSWEKVAEKYMLMIFNQQNTKFNTRKLT